MWTLSSTASLLPPIPATLLSLCQFKSLLNLIFCLGTGLSDTSPDEGLIEDLTIEDKAVEQLAEGLLSHYLPDLQRSKQALQELTWANKNHWRPHLSSGIVIIYCISKVYTVLGIMLYNNTIEYFFIFCDSKWTWSN